MFKSVKRFFSSLVKTSEDRMTNPVISTFAISWVLINWRPVLVLLLSNSSIEGKIEYIKQWDEKIEFWLWWPLGITLFYVLFLPVIQHTIETLLEGVTDKRRKRHHSERKSELSEQVVIEGLKTQVQRAKIDTTETGNYKEIIESQKARIAALEEENKNIKISGNQSIADLRDENERLLTEKNNLETDNIKQRSAVQSFENTLKSMHDRIELLTRERDQAINDVESLSELSKSEYRAQRARMIEERGAYRDALSRFVSVLRTRMTALQSFLDTSDAKDLSSDRTLSKKTSDFLTSFRMTLDTDADKVNREIQRLDELQ